MTGRISLVTGTSGGLGLEFVSQLSRNPDDLVIALSRNPFSSLKLQALASERKNVVLVKGDTTDDSSMRVAVEEVEKNIAGKGIDLLIANAGAASPSTTQRGAYEMAVEPFSTGPLGDFTNLFEVNVVGSIRTVNSFLPLVKKGNEKKIILISTTLASCTYVDVNNPMDNSIGSFGPYSVSKAALNMAARKYAVELNKDGITVLNVAPGWIKTNLSGADIAPLEPTPAIEKVIKKIDTVTLNDSGKFIDASEDKVVPF
ncbi:NAD(P)-binding protein [Atractiella rhizophila]|nr:NAD(P)-binding protein [Atractiella rhizophila]